MSVQGQPATLVEPPVQALPPAPVPGEREEDAGSY